MSRNWAQRKIYLYNVTFGLYMLDPWERYLFNAVVAVLMWFIFYNGYRNLDEICKSPNTRAIHYMLAFRGPRELAVSMEYGIQ
ncbi:putative small subunit of serine palmitoyltransferase [Helianthus anomalus]